MSQLLQFIIVVIVVAFGIFCFGFGFFAARHLLRAMTGSQMTKPIKTKVTNSADFKTQVADHDYAEYKRGPTNLRLAYHLAVSFFHLRDWTFAEYSGHGELALCYQLGRLSARS